MSRSKKRKELPNEATDAIEVLAESTENTADLRQVGMFENADPRVNEASAVDIVAEPPKPEQFYCFATGCPGYDYRADVKAHPVATCGTIVNCVHLSKTSPPPAANETTEAVSETEAPISETIPAMAELEPAEIEPPPVTTPGLEPPEPPPELPKPEPAPEIVPEVEPFPRILPDMPGLEEPDDVASNPPTAEGLLVPEIGSLWEYWTNGWLQLVEVLGIAGVATVDPLTQVGVMLYSTALPTMQDSKSGNASGAFFNVEDFNNGRLLSWESPVPGWVIKELSEAAQALLTLDQVEDRDFSDVFPDTPILEEPNDGAIEPSSYSEAPELDFDGAFNTRIGALADELGVRPLHVSRVVESVMDLAVQVLTFNGNMQGSPAIASLRDRVMQEANQSRGLMVTLMAVGRPLLAQMFERTAQEFWETKAEELHTWTSQIESNVADFRVALKAVDDQVKSFTKYATQDASKGALELTEQALDRATAYVDKVGDRVFALESWQKRIQTEIGNYARSVKLQKHDPKSAAQRGKAFREREKRLKEENEKNLQLVREQKAEAERVEGGGKAKPGPKAKAKYKGPPIKRPRGRPRKHPLVGPPKPRQTPAVKRKRLSDIAASNAAAADPKRRKGKPPKKVKASPETQDAYLRGKAVRKFMGKFSDAGVAKLLTSIHPSKFYAFTNQAKNGLPDMVALKWTPSQMSTFAKWYYGRQPSKR